jgi:hypothetical protein
VAAKPQRRIIVTTAAGVNYSLTIIHGIAFVLQWRRPNPAERVPASAATMRVRLIRSMASMAELTGNPGFARPRAERTQLRRRAIALELIATGALTVSLIVAATAVSMGDRSLVRGNAGIARPLMQMPPLRQ